MSRRKLPTICKSSTQWFSLAERRPGHQTKPKRSVIQTVLSNFHPDVQPCLESSCRQLLYNTAMLPAAPVLADSWVSHPSAEHFDCSSAHAERGSGRSCSAASKARADAASFSSAVIGRRSPRFSSSLDPACCACWPENMMPAACKGAKKTCSVRRHCWHHGQ